MTPLFWNVLFYAGIFVMGVGLGRLAAAWARRPTRPSASRRVWRAPDKPREK
jgi:hypothetical protein